MRYNLNDNFQKENSFIAKSMMSLSLLLFCCLLFISCNKTEFLGEKPRTDIVVPTKLPELLALLDNDLSIFGVTPPLGEQSSDDHYLTTDYWLARTPIDRNTYVWAQDIFEGQGNINDWNLQYQQVFYANQILYALDGIERNSSNQEEWDNIKGNALFFRAFAFFNVAQIFAPVYDNATANTDLGIPLRLKPDVTAPTIRATVKETYDQIIKDLNEAKDLLPTSIPLNNRNRASKPAVFAMLARVYLSMRSYSDAKMAAHSALQLYSSLIDYNTISTTLNLPFDRNNIETIFQSRFSPSTPLRAQLGQANVDSFLYASYDLNDLRRSIYFRTSGTFIRIKGGYSGQINPFSGLATDELFLILAECEARENNVTDAMKNLNDLLRTRWKKVSGVSTYLDMSAANAGDALSKVLIERRKELVWRGIRFTDLRRLNKEGANIVLTRVVNGQTYTLAPDSPRYVLPIPPDVIAISGIQQNPR